MSGAPAILAPTADVAAVSPLAEAGAVLAAVRPLAEAGVVLAALLAAAALLLRPARARAAATLGALVLAPALLLGHVWSSDQLAALRDRPAVLVVAGALGLVVAAALAWAFVRRPVLLPLAAALALPFRVPIAVGDSTADLLVPLYLVVGAGALAYAVPRLRRAAPPERAPGALEWALAAVLVLFALQATYSSDPDRALEQVVFFYVPFAVLFALLARLEWSPRLARHALGVLLALALVFVAIGAWEYATRQLLLNPRVITSNAFESYFRVNSLFFDPNMYGRFLVVVVLGVAAAVLWTRRAQVALGGAAVLAVLWAGLVVTFSQSSFTALLAGLAVLGGLRWGLARAAGVVGALAVAGVAVVLLAPGAMRLELDDADDVRDATSGRSALVLGGVRLFADRPVLGWGSGSFRREYRRREGVSDRRATAASHTIPVTVAAEQGVVGLAAYLALLVAALARLLARAGRSVARAAVAAAFVAVVVHTMLYAAFLEDPLTWALLGAGTALARAAPLERRAVRRAPVERSRPAAADRGARVSAGVGPPVGPAERGGPA